MGHNAGLENATQKNALVKSAEKVSYIMRHIS